MLLEERRSSLSWAVNFQIPGENADWPDFGWEVVLKVGVLLCVCVCVCAGGGSMMDSSLRSRERAGQIKQ